MLVFFSSGVDRPNIKNLLLAGIIESLIGKRKGPQENQHNSQKQGDFISDSATKPCFSDLVSG